MLFNLMSNVKQHRVHFRISLLDSLILLRGNLNIHMMTHMYIMHTGCSKKDLIAPPPRLRIVLNLYRMSGEGILLIFPRWGMDIFEMTH